MTECEIEMFFEEIRRCRYHIDSLNQLKIQYEMDLFSLKGIRYDKEPVDGGILSDVSDIVIEFENKMKKSEEIRINELNRYGDLCGKAFVMIGVINNPRSKAIMIDRYFMNYSWNKISRKNHYDKSTCYRIRDKSIKEIYEKTNVATKCDFEK